MKIERNKVYNMDAFELLEQMEDDSIDLVVTDPPFGDNYAYGKLGKAILGNENVNINFDYMDAVYDKMKDNTTMYIFTNHKFADQLKQYAIRPLLDDGKTINLRKFNYRMTIVLIKNNFGLGYGFRNQHEFILVLEKGKAKYNLKNFSNVVQMKHVAHEPDTHPHVKNWEVIRKMILHSSQVGDLVLDSFMGSFTTAKACFKENRDFIGTELDVKWFEKYDKELKGLMNQTTLF